MKLRLIILILFGPIALNSCGSGSSGAVSLSAVSAPLPVATLPEPCLSSICATKLEQFHIFDAENSVFSSGGRLFISGGEDVYEVTAKSNGELEISIISAEMCNFTGLAIKDTVLYAACGDNRLFAADISNLPIRPIYTIANSQLANGLTELEGRLYITDGPLSFPSKIIQLQINPSNNLQITSQQDWTATGELNSANGIQTVKDEIWVTDFNELKAYAVDVNGVKGAVRTILTHGSNALDDFTVLESGNIVINDFVGGVSLIFDSNGNELENTNNVVGPSSAIQGQPPMFNSSQIIITEKGTLGDNTQGNGNRLAIFTAK